MTIGQTLDSVCAAIVDCEHKTVPVDESGDFFAVGTPAMRGNAIDYGEARRISTATFEAWTRRLRPRSGDLLLAREAPVGPVVLIPPAENVAPGQRTVLLRPDPSRVDSVFLFYLLASPTQQDRLRAMAEGSTVAHLNVVDVRGFQLPALPAVPEQRAIADVLSALDDKIAANARLCEGAERLALILVESSGSPVPLGEVVTHRKLVVDPSALTSERVAHFSLPAFDTGRMPEMVEPRTIKSSKFLVTSPSVLVSKLNPRFPRTWDVATVPDQPALASTEFLVLEPALSTSTVLWALLSQPAFGAALESKVAGTSGSHQRVRPEDLLDTPVPDPRGMSDKLKDQVSALGLRAIRARIESGHLAATRDALLPALMSGSLRVRDAESGVSGSGR